MKQKNNVKAVSVLLAILAVVLLVGCRETENIATDSEESLITESSEVTENSEESESEESVSEEETNEYIEAIAPAVEIEDGYRDGDFYGTLTIEEAEIEVPLYYTTILGEGKSAQEIIDNTESAGYFRYGEQHIIADHDYQEFFSLKKVKKGTKAVIALDRGYEKTYECIRVCEGENRGHLYDENKEDVAEQNPGGIAMYTCNGSKEKVIICFFEQVAE